MIKSQSWERQKEKSEKIKEKLKVFNQAQLHLAACFE